MGGSLVLALARRARSSTGAQRAGVID